MDWDSELPPGSVIPGGGPSARAGLVISVPVAATLTDQVILGGDAVLMGWSFRESSGVMSGLAELYDGSGSNGVLMGVMAPSSPVGGTIFSVEGTSVAPGANGVIVNASPIPAGTFDIIVNASYGGTADVADNMKLVLAGVSTITVLEVTPVANAQPITREIKGFTVTPAQAGNALQIQAINAGGAGTVFKASLDVTPAVGSAGQGGVAQIDTQWFGPTGIYLQAGLAIHPLQGTLKGTVWIRR